MSQQTIDSLARLIALVLPQFHPTPDNDAWWGKGFTEWTNVARSKPLFEGHYQPHLPAELGFYDLRLPEVRELQADLARSHGIEAFCYWHYWFEGRRILERPTNEILKLGKPDFPFCFSWANETWSRRWLGEERDILISQTYSAADDVAHIRSLIPAFEDARYLRVNDRPIFLIYRPNDLPDPERTVETFRVEARAAGIEDPFLLAMNSHQDIDYRTLGFDGTVDFEPALGALSGPMDSGLKVYDYPTARRRMHEKKSKRDFPTYPCVFVSWDNTPRRGREGIVFVNSGPDQFESELQRSVELVMDRPKEDRLVFVNAWNEWAEGNHLEPDQRYGRAFLEAVARVSRGGSQL
jgi:O-antigen biosynthesis protein